MQNEILYLDLEEVSTTCSGNNISHQFYSDLLNYLYRMSKRLNFLMPIFICFVLSNSLFASRLEGLVSNENNEPLPFCNVYIKNSNYACATNENGFYSLTVEPGNYVVIFQYIGYTKQEISVTITNENKILNEILLEEATALQEVVIRSDKEDPAYAIIRSAIEKRSAHLKEISSFSCEVYIKGLQKFTEAPDKILGVELNTILDVDTNNTGIIYLSESVSNFHFQYPDKTKEVMKASIVSGNDQSFSWNDAASMEMNFYENLETLEGFSQRGFVSPIADNAMFFYEYKLLSSIFDNNHEIYKIKVIPKRKTDPAYSGIIYITDDDYHINGLQLELRKENGLEFLDTFRVEQEYFYSDNEHLSLLSNKFNFNYSLFGIKGNGFFHAFYKDYTINPIFPKNFFTAEVTKIEENSNKKDSIYWSNSRPIKLTSEEQIDYRKKDSLQILKETPAYQDSVDRIFNKFSASDLISGYNYRRSRSDLFISTNPLPEIIQFNTVEGYVVNFRVRLSKEWDSKDVITLIPNIRYAIGADKVFANGSISYMYDQFTRSTISLRGGSNVMQFNESGIIPLVNSFYSLLVEENYLKLYQSQYLEANYSKELFNGFYASFSAGFRDRNYLNNLDIIDSWIDVPDKTFTPNYYPFSDEALNTDMPARISAGISIRYQIKQKYIMQPDEKYILESKYPRLEFSYEKALDDLIENSVRYDKVELSIQDNIKLGLPGNLQYHSSMGLMFGTRNLTAADKFNFAGNETLISRLTIDSYFLLPYYSALSENYYYTAHLQWHTEGFLFRKLPLFKQLKLEPVFTAQYLQSDAINNYFEVAAGIEHIFKIARIDFAYTPFRFDDSYPSEQFRILLGIGF